MSLQDNIVQLDIRRRKPQVGAQVNWGHRASVGLTGCWLFNEGSGNRIHDLSQTQGHGNFVNIDPNTAWVPEINGPALSFDGDRDYVTIPDSIPLANISAPWSVVAYTYLKSTVIDAQSTVCSLKSPSGTPNLKLAYIVTASYNPIYWGDNSPWGKHRIGGNFLRDDYEDKWTQLIISYKGSNPTDSANSWLAYVNGVPMPITTVGPGSGSFTSDTEFGALSGNTGADFEGYFDHIYTYNRIITPADAVELYTDPYGMFYPYDVGLLTIGATTAAAAGGGKKDKIIGGF